MIPHAALTNGITATGECHFWDKFPSLNAIYVYVISFNVFFTYLPMAMMLVAYVRIYIRIRRKGMASKVKYNVVKMLSTCVLMYFGCHVLRLVLCVVNRFTAVNQLAGITWIIAILMMQFNSMVNLIVYALQYKEYRKELGRQVYRMFRVRIDHKVASSDITAQSTDNMSTSKEKVTRTKQI